MFQFKRNQIIVTVLVFMIAIAAYLGLSEPSMTTTPEMVKANQGDEGNAVVNEVTPDGDFFDQFAVMETLPPDGENLEATTPEQNIALIGEEDGVVPTEEQQVASTDEQVAPGEEAVISEEAIAPLEANQVVITKKVSDETMVASSGDVVTDKTVDVSYFAEERMLREQSRAAQIEQLNEYVANDDMDQETKAKAAESLLVIQDRIEKETSAESLLRAKGFKDVFVRMDEDTVDVVVSSDKLSDEEIAQIEEIVHRKTGYTMGQIKISCLKVNADSNKQ